MSKITEAEKAWKEYEKELQAVQAKEPPEEIRINIVHWGEIIGEVIGVVSFYPRTGHWQIRNEKTQFRYERS